MRGTLEIHPSVETDTNRPIHYQGSVAPRKVKAARPRRSRDLRGGEYRRAIRKEARPMRQLDYEVSGRGMSWKGRSLLVLRLRRCYFNWCDISIRVSTQ